MIVHIVYMDLKKLFIKRIEKNKETVQQNR